MRRRKRFKGPAFKREDLPRLLILLAGAGFLGWLSIHSAAAENVSARTLRPALALAGDDPRVVVRLAAIQFRRSPTGLAPAIQAEVRSILNDAPLFEQPFLYEAVNQLMAGDGRAAEPLLEEARRRNPRSRETRLLLLDRYLRRGQAKEAAIEVTGLSRLIPDSRQVLIPELARFANDPATSATLLAAIRSDAGMREMILEHLATSGADPDIVLRLARASRSAAPPSSASSWWQPLLSTLVKRGEIARAYALWQEFFDINDHRRDAVYNSSFGDMPGSPPFDWSFSGSGAGIAEAGASGLDVDYYGRAPSDLASQVILLPSNRYRLSVAAEGEPSQGPAGLVWTVECIGSQVEIARLPVENLSYAGRVIAVDFAVPSENCEAQSLTLKGVPQEFPVPDSATFRMIEIERRAR